MASRKTGRPENEEDELAALGAARGAVGPGPEEDKVLEIMKEAADPKAAAAAAALLVNGIQEQEAEGYGSDAESGDAASSQVSEVSGSTWTPPDKNPSQSLGENQSQVASLGEGNSGDESLPEANLAHLMLLRAGAARPPDVSHLVREENFKWAATETGRLQRLTDEDISKEAHRLFSTFPEAATREDAVLKNGYQILAAGNDPITNPHYQKTLYTMILCWLLDGLGHDQIYGSNVNRSQLLKVFLDAHPELDLHYKIELKTHVIEPKSDASAKAIIVSALKDLAVTLGIPMNAETMNYDAAGAASLVKLLDGNPGVLSVDSLRGNYKDVLSTASGTITLYFGKSAAVLGDPASFTPETAKKTSEYHGRIGVATQVGTHTATGATGMPMSVRTTMTLLDDNRVQKLIEFSSGKVITATFTNKGVSITQVQKLAEFLISGVKGDFSWLNGNTITGPNLEIILSRPRAEFSIYELVAVCVGLKTDGDFGIGRNMADLPGSLVRYTIAGGETLAPGSYTDVHMSIDIIASIFGKVFASKLGFLMHSERMELFSGVALQKGVSEDGVLALLRTLKEKVTGTVRYTASTAPGRDRRSVEEGKILESKDNLETIAKGNKSPDTIDNLFSEINRHILNLEEGSAARAFLQELWESYQTSLANNGGTITDDNKGSFEELARTKLEEKKAIFDEASKKYLEDKISIVRYDLTDLGKKRLGDATSWANENIKKIFEDFDPKKDKTCLIRDVLKLYYSKVAELNANENLRSGQRFIDPVGMLTAESYSELRTLYQGSEEVLNKALVDLDEGAMVSNVELLRKHSENIEGNHDPRFTMTNLTKLFIKFGFTNLVSSQVAGYLAAITSNPNSVRLGERENDSTIIPEEEAFQSDDDSVRENSIKKFQTLFAEAYSRNGRNKDLAIKEIIEVVITLLTDGKVPDLEGRMSPLPAGAEAAPGGGAAGMPDEMPDEEASAAGGAPESRRSGRFRPNYPNSIPREQVNEFKGAGGGFLPFLTKVEYDGKNHIYEYGKNKYILVQNPDGFYTAKRSQGGGSRKYRNRKTFKKQKKSKRSRQSRKINKLSRKST